MSIAGLLIALVDEPLGFSAQAVAPVMLILVHQQRSHDVDIQPALDFVIHLIAQILNGYRQIVRHKLRGQRCGFYREAGKVAAHMHDVGGCQASHRNDSVVHQAGYVQVVYILPRHHLRQLSMRQRPLAQRFTKGPLLLAIARGICRLAHQHIVLVQIRCVLDFLVDQRAQVVQHLGMLYRQRAQRHHAVGFQLHLAVVIVHAGVAAQSKRAHKQAADKGFPFAHAHAVNGLYGQVVFYQCNVGGGAAHVHHHAVGLPG